VSSCFESSIDELHEVYEIRIVLEPLATEIAAKQISDDEIAALERHRDADAEGQAGALRRAQTKSSTVASTPPRKEAPARDHLDKLRENGPRTTSVSVSRDPVPPGHYRTEVEMEHEEIVEGLKARGPREAGGAGDARAPRAQRPACGELIAGEAGTLGLGARPAPSASRTIGGGLTDEREQAGARYPGREPR